MTISIREEVLRAAVAFRAAGGRVEAADCSVCRANAVSDACEAWAKGKLFTAAHNRELARLIFDTAEAASSDVTLSPWDRAVLRLSMLHVQLKLGLKDADPRSRTHLAEQVLGTLRDARALAPTSLDRAIVRWTCLFCIARPPRRKAVNRNEWEADASMTVEALAELNLSSHAEHLARALAIRFPPASKLQGGFRELDEPDCRTKDVIDQIQRPRRLAPQMGAGISSLVRYLKANAGDLEIVKTPQGLLQLR